VPFPWEDHWGTPLAAIREQLGLTAAVPAE
jgi:hypothetical protein